MLLIYKKDTVSSLKITAFVCVVLIFYSYYSMYRKSFGDVQ